MARIQGECKQLDCLGCSETDGLMIDFAEVLQEELRQETNHE